MRVEAREIDEIGTEGIIKKIWERVGKNHAYLSVDIDVLDPAFAPATGTPETGGWSTRELRTIIRGLDGMKLVGMDLVEVATPYDTVSSPLMESFNPDRPQSIPRWPLPMLFMRF
jgi:agmatinase